MKKILSSTTVIRFQDCDPYNHLNNAEYLNYFVNCREDQVLKEYGLDVYEHAKKEKAAWVVSTNEISYVRPVVTHQTVLVETSIIEYSNKHLKVEMLMFDENRTSLKAVYWTTYVYFDFITQKPKNHSAELITLFEQTIVPIEKKVFDARQKELRAINFEEVVDAPIV